VSSRQRSIDRRGRLGGLKRLGVEIPAHRIACDRAAADHATILIEVQVSDSRGMRATAAPEVIREAAYLIGGLRRSSIRMPE
jgi:hypothetical protein